MPLPFVHQDYTHTHTAMSSATSTDEGAVAEQVFMALSNFGVHQQTLSSRLACARLSSSVAGNLLDSRGVGGLELRYVPSFFLDGEVPEECDDDDVDRCPVLMTTTRVRVEEGEPEEGCDGGDVVDETKLTLVSSVQPFSSLPTDATASRTRPATIDDNSGGDKVARRQERLRAAREADRQRAMHNPIYWFAPGGVAIPSELKAAQEAWRAVVDSAVDMARARVELSRVVDLL